MAGNTFCNSVIPNASSLPEPEKTGVDSTQIKTASEVVVIPPTPNEEALLSNAIAAYREKGFTPSHMGLVVFGAKHMEGQIRDLTRERDKLRHELDATKEAQHKAERLIERLDEKLRNAANVGVGTNIAQTIGGVALGAGLQQIMTTTPSAFAWAGIVAGAILIVSGWIPGFLASQREKKP